MSPPPLKRTSITSFSGDYRWLSNFAPVSVFIPDGEDFSSYPTVENAYQAAKANMCDRWQFSDCSPADAKRRGKGVWQRYNFHEKKLQIMEALCWQKFQQEPYEELLLATGDMKIVEGNTWGDVFWGRCNGVGENHLGRIIMEIREKMRQDLDTRPRT